jgi:hypothetical protein
VQTQQFVAGEVLMLSGDPPDFRDVELPLPLANGGVVLLSDEAVALRRAACRRYVEARTELQGAASLLQDWFAAQRSAHKSELRNAIESVIAQHGQPGKTVQWGRFCDLVRTECGMAASTRDYGDKTIQRTVRAIVSKEDKSDIADMSDMSC